MEGWQTGRVIIAFNGLVDCVPIIMSIIIAKFVPKLHLLAKDLSSYTVHPTNVGFCSCCSRPADLELKRRNLWPSKGNCGCSPTWKLMTRGCTWNTGSLSYISLISLMKASQRPLSRSGLVRRGTMSNHQSKPMVKRYCGTGAITDLKAKEYVSKGTELKLHISVINVVGPSLQKPYRLKDCEKLELSVLVRSVGGLARQ